MRLLSVRRVVLVAALAVAAFGAISLVSATQDPLAAQAATATPSPTATMVATPVATLATATATPATTAAATATPTPTPTPTPSPVDEGFGRFTDACTDVDIEVDAAPPVLVERLTLASGGSRVTARLQPPQLVANAAPYTGGETASTVAELGDAGDVVQKEITLTFTATGGHTLTLTYSLDITSDAATAALSQVTGHCGPKR